MGRNKALPALIWLAVLGGSTVVSVLAACNDNPLIEVPACRPGLCTCEEDPTQVTCKGFNDRPEGGKDPADATPVETSVPEDAAPDAGEDAAADADAGD
jgi:hypothetical protein